MNAPNKTQAMIDRFAAAVDNERLQGRFVEDLDDEPFCRFQDWVDSLTEVVDAVDTARDAIEEWQMAEGRDEKADAKESALEALDSLVQTWNGSPLDLSNLTDWDPES